MPSLRDCAAKLGKALDESLIQQAEIYMELNNTSEVEAVTAILNGMQQQRQTLPEGKPLLAPFATNSRDYLVFDDEAAARKFIKKKGAMQYSRDDVLTYVQNNGVQIDEIVADEDAEQNFEPEWEQRDWDEANDEDVDVRLEDYDGGHDDDVHPGGLDGWADENLQKVKDNILTSAPPDLVDAIENANDASELEPLYDEAGYDWEEEVRQLARDDAEEIYRGYVNDVPYQIVTVEGIDESKARITGNDDVGWSWMYNATNMQYQGDTSSLEEAKIQLTAELRDYGELDEQMGDENTTRWGEYIDVNEPASAKNYREIKITLPNNPETFVESAHFDDENIVAFLRVTDRQISAGEQNIEVRDVGDVGDQKAIFVNGDQWGQPFPPKMADKMLEDAQRRGNIGRDNALYIDEFQSDWHQQGAREGYKDADAANAKRRYFEAQDALDSIQNEIVKKFFGTDDITNSGSIESPSGLGRIGVNSVESALYDWIKTGSHEVWANNENVKFLQEWFVENITDSELQHMVELKSEVGETRTVAFNNNMIPDAPFKGSNWVSLGLKRAIIHAVESGYDQLAWADAAANADRWNSDIEKYDAHYDGKMPSIVKKLTGVEPQHFDMAGDPYPEIPEFVAPVIEVVREDVNYREDTTRWAIKPDNPEQEQAFVVKVDGKYYEAPPGMTALFPTRNQAQRELEMLDQYYKDKFEEDNESPNGYWSIPITDELKAKVRDEGFSMFQDNRGEIQLVDEKRIIKLSETSDPSTFIHELGHLFLETEKQFMDEFGETDNQRTLAKWLEVESLADIDPTTPEGVEKHEKVARAFEAYMYEGTAPSLSLRDAFAAIKSWMLRVYESIKQLDVELSDEIRGVFDRMLATQTELEAAKGDPVYNQYFSSPEAAGMTPAEFADYQEKVKRRDNRATETVDAKLLKEYRKRRQAEWREERAPLVDEEYERLSKQSVYQLMGDLAIAPMDYDMVVAATDDGKLPTKLIGKARKEDGVDPQEYAEVYGYDSVKQMLDDIQQAPSLKKAAEDAAQQRMIEKHGDIMNDGSLEIEIQDALHNDAQAQVLLMELKALKPESANKINREFLKAEAKRVIAEMTYKEIQPNKYYRNEMRAAKRAGEARPDMKAEIYDAKVSQLANHYLYREAVEARAKMQRNRRYVRAAQKRKYDPKAVDGDYIANIKALASVYDMSDNPARQKQQLSGLLTWFNAAVKREDVELQMMDPNLLLAMAAKENTSHPEDWVKFSLPKFDELTANDLQGLTDMLKHMRHVGGQMSMLQNDEITRERVELTDSIISNGGGDVRDPSTRGRKMPGMDHVRHMANKLPSLRNMMRKLDGVWDNEGAEGVADRLIHRRLEDANNEFLRLKEEIYDRFNEEMEGIHYIGLSGAGFTTEFRRKYGIPDANEVEIIAEGGNRVVMNPEELFMTALYWGTESSRDAIKEGHGLTDADVMRLLSNLTEDQLNFVNRVWKVNESIWPDLSSAAIKRYGVSPEKLDPTPFVVNGVEMTGGHMRLFYNSLDLDIKKEQESGQEYASIVPSKAGSLHERVGSGGRPVLLDRNNIVRAIDENIHFIAYAEAGNHIRRLVNAPDVQDSIQRKHGEPFHRAMVEQLDMIIRNKPAQEQIKGLAAAFRLLRKAATYRHLVLSVRNVVQQGTALPIIMNEVGTANWVSAAQRVHFEEGTREFIMEKSAFMRNRTSFVNREAAEYLNKLSVDGPVKATWERFAAIGFTPQTAVDSVLAFPTWLAKYEEAINKHGDARRAVSEADIAVSESVGSGADLHLGGAFNSNASELTRTMTLFGSWFNAYYQRMYRDTRGFTTMTPASAHTIFTLPMIVGTMSAVLVTDIPDEDESIEGWLARNYFMFVAGTVPIVRDMVTFHHSGFSPKTVLSGLQEGPGRVISEVDAMIEGRQSGLKTANDLAKIATTIVPVPGSGQVTRTVDFIDSYNQGEEGDMSAFKAYQALVEGPDRNK